MSDIRIDKFLWCVRLYKTRSLSSEACRKGHVIIGNTPVKPSRLVVAGEHIEVKKAPITFCFKVIDITHSRVGAKLVDNYIQNITSDEQRKMIEMLKLDRKNQRPKGLGRPTKKERREIDMFFDNGL